MLSADATEFCNACLEFFGNTAFLFCFLFTGHSKISSSFVYEKFSSLANTHLIQRCPNPLEEAVDDVDERELSRLYTVPPFCSSGKFYHVYD